MDRIRCPKCDNAREKFKKRKNRITNARGKDTRKINNRFLPKSALQAKTKSLSKDKNFLNKTVKYLKRRIRRLIEAESVALGCDTSKELCSILKKNVSNMSDLQKLVWGEQLKAISRQHNPRSVRWSPMMIKIALHIQMQSPSAYEYLRESGILKLPSQRRLFDFTHFTEAKNGIQDDILNLLEEKINKMVKEEHEKYFNLLFDEMTIHQSLVISKNGEVVGFSCFNEIENSVAQLEAHLQGQEMKKEKAKKVLVFMHEVVAIYPTVELNAQQLYTRVWDVIYNLETRDIRVLSLIFDGASCNKKFKMMHVKLDSSSDFVYSTKNVASPENRPLFFIVDPPHLIKTIRNCFSNSNGHKHTRDMLKNNEKMSWEAVEKLHSVSISEKYKFHKLTQAHARLTPFSRMNVNLATQTMSASVARALLYYMSDIRFHGLINPELINFIEKVNLLFDCLNGSNDPDGKRNKTNKYLQPYSSHQDERFKILKTDVLRFFQDWHKECNEEIGLSKEAKERRTVSEQSYSSLHITIQGFCGAVNFLLAKGAPSIDAKKFNQDKLEQYFGLMRMAGGASNNPTLHEVRRKTLAFVPQKAAALPKKKGNTLGERRQLEVNQDALPCRPRKK
ncbi:Transposable element P transposase [Frankliniella fusca]|uniref:Transposable element P transposase n=1 Tax=Frankliniella fusca TaxID=407009 RepID=A0AAE1LKI8_9NEOP|nr:Transposable element P transposase [Frankliniella fusca]